MKITPKQLKQIIREELEAVNAISQEVIAKSVAKVVLPKLKDVDLPPELQMFADKSPEEISAMLKGKLEEARGEDAYYGSQGGGISTGAGKWSSVSGDERNQATTRTLDRGGESKPISVVADGVEVVKKALQVSGALGGSFAAGAGIGKLITLGVTAALSSGPMVPAALAGAVIAGILGYGVRDFQAFSQNLK